jgi:hypothetical protein
VWAGFVFSRAGDRLGSGFVCSKDYGAVCANSRPLVDSEGIRELLI